MKLSEIANLKSVELKIDGDFSNLGLLTHLQNDLFVCLHNLDYLDVFLENPNIKCVITSNEIFSKIDLTRYGVVLSNDPLDEFYQIHHLLLDKTDFYGVKFKSIIVQHVIMEVVIIIINTTITTHIAKSIFN